MFGRTVLRQARRFSTRNLTAATQNSVVPLSVVRQQRFAPAPIHPGFRRLYSGAPAVEAKDKGKAPEDAIKEVGAQLEQETKVNEELERLVKELETKTKEAKDFKDKFTRAVADFRNLQDRTEREKKSARDFAIQKFAKDLIESVDNLDRALQAVPEEARSDAEKNKDLVDFYNGLKITESILLSTMEKHGLEKMDPIGEVFDPNKHEATFQVPVPDKEPNTVFHVQQTGFLLNGRTIRAAKVGVTSAPK